MPQLNVKYLSQTDNVRNPYGSCNVTSIAMCLYYFGIRGDKSMPQLEDQLYDRCIKNGWSRHSWWDLQRLVHTYPNMNDVVSEYADLGTIRKSIDAGRPVVLHGFFTKFGHIIVVYGYDADGFLVHDPYGEYWATGYDVNTLTHPNKGEALHYSTKMIERVCAPDGRIVMHSIGRVV